MPKLTDALLAGAGTALQTGLGLPPAPVPPPVPVAAMAETQVSPMWKGSTFFLLALLGAVILWPKKSHARRRRSHRR